MNPSHVPLPSCPHTSRETVIRHASSANSLRLIVVRLSADDRVAGERCVAQLVGKPEDPEELPDDEVGAVRRAGVTRDLSGKINQAPACLMCTQGHATGGLLVYAPTRATRLAHPQHRVCAGVRSEFIDNARRL